MKALIPILIILLCIISCNEKDDHPENYNHYPLAIGNKWKYYSEYQLNINGQPDTTRIISTWIVFDDTVINAEKAYIILQVDSNFDGTICKGKTYYANRADGLYALGYQNNCTVSQWFKSEESFIKSSLLHPFIYNQSNYDSVIIVEKPLFLLKFPIEIGENWTTFQIAPALGCFRKWISTERVETNLGELECSKLEIILDSTDFLQPIFQYISNKGFTKEEYIDTINSMDYITVYSWTILQEVNF